MHFGNEPYKDRMRDVDVDLLRIADEGACSVTLAPSYIKHSSACLGITTARTSQKGEAVRNYYETPVFSDL